MPLAATFARSNCARCTTKIVIERERILGLEICWQTTNRVCWDSSEAECI